MSDGEVLESARELLSGAEGGRTPAFQTGDITACSKKSCEVRFTSIRFGNWGLNVLGWKVVILSNTVSYEYDGCDVLNGDVSMTTTRTRPLDTAKLTWTFRPVASSRESGCPKCCGRSRCLELTVRNELVSGLNIWRLIGIGGNSIWERKFRICGDGSWQQIT